MIKKRIGTDLFLTLEVKDHNDEKMDLTTVEDIHVEVWYSAYSNVRSEQAFTVEAPNIIKFQYSAEENKRIGTYGVTVSFKKTDTGSETGVIQMRVDFCDIFTIVPFSCQENMSDLHLSGIVVAVGKDGVVTEEQIRNIADTIKVDINIESYGKIEYIDKEIADVSQGIINLSESITHLRERDTDLQSQIEGNDDDIVGLQAEHADTASQIVDINNKVLQDVKDVTYDHDTGVFTFTKHSGAVITIDLPIENIVSSGRYNPDTKSLVLTLRSGETLSIPVEDLIKEYAGSEGDNIQIVVGAEGIISAILKNGSITKEKLSTDLQTSINSIAHKVNQVEGKVLSSNDYTTLERNKLMSMATGLTPEWKLGLDSKDISLEKEIGKKQNRLTAGTGVSIEPIGNDLVISSEGRISKVLRFADTKEFVATKGLPEQQGWEQRITGSAIIANVAIGNLMMTELTDSTNGGKADIVKTMTNEEFKAMLQFGGRFYGVSKLDQTHGNEGFWVGMQYNQSYRFGLQFRNEGGYLQVKGLGGAQVVNPITTFDGTDGKQRIWFTDTFKWEVVIPKNDDPEADYLMINSGDLFINNMATGIQVDYVAGGGIGNTGCYLSSMSTGGDEHVSYHSIFGYAINTTEVVVTEEVIKDIDDLTIITPEGNLDLIVTFDASIKGRHAGDTFNIVANNVGGSISINGNAVFLINGGQDIEIEIKEVGNFVATNGVDRGNEYSMSIPRLAVDGKSAYQQAVEGGYEGSESEFTHQLSIIKDKADSLIDVTSTDTTPTVNCENNRRYFFDVITSLGLSKAPLFDRYSVCMISFKTNDTLPTITVGEGLIGLGEYDIAVNAEVSMIIKGNVITCNSVVL